MGILGLFSDEKHTNSTSSSNTSNTYSSADSHDVAINTSINKTSNSTDTFIQDRRNVADNGAFVVSADNSNLTTQNSNNNTSTVNNITNTSIGYTSTDYGAMRAGIAMSNGAIASNQALASEAVDASRYMMGAGVDMLKANLAYSQHVTDGGYDLAKKLTQDANAESRNAIREVVAATGNALNQVVAVASKPLDANDPQRLVIIVALGVVGLVFFSKLRA